MLGVTLLLSVSGSAHAFICLMMAAADNKRAIPRSAYPPPLWLTPRPGIHPIPEFYRYPPKRSAVSTNGASRPSGSHGLIWRPVN